jgi:hypothetical protein
VRRRANSRDLHFNLHVCVVLCCVSCVYVHLVLVADWRHTMSSTHGDTDDDAMRTLFAKSSSASSSSPRLPLLTTTIEEYVHTPRDVTFYILQYFGNPQTFDLGLRTCAPHYLSYLYLLSMNSTVDGYVL